MLRKQLHALWIGLGAAFLALLLWDSGWLDPLELAVWRVPVRWMAAPSPHTRRIKIVAIDETSLAYMLEKDPENLKWPWPRQVYAPLLAFLQRAEARVVVFDMLFTEVSRLRGDDDVFAEALRAAPPCVLALSLSDAKGRTAWPEYAPPPALPAAGGRPDEAVESYPYALFPVAPLARAVARLGNVTEEPDADGIIRRVHLFRGFDGRLVPSLALAALQAAGKGQRLRVEGRTLYGTTASPPPVNGAGTLLRFRGPAGTHEKLRAAALIESELRLQAGRDDPPVDPERLRGCYVFVGPTAKALHDLQATPVDAKYPGVEVQATALDNLLAGDFLRKTPFWLAALSTVLLAVLAASAALAPRETWHSAAAFALFVPLPALLAFGAYAAGLWWPAVMQGIAVLAALVAAVTANYMVEGRQRRFVKQAFQHYLSPDVINRILADPSRLRLGGERREMSIFFSDIQGFTTISEKLEPQDLTALLNDYLSDMTDIILDEGGTLDKYEGDAIIAFWNAPADQPDHPARAVRAALRCQRKLAARRAEFQTRTGSALYMRIGIHTGDVVVGNMGSRRRFDYTVLGDAANLAARLEGANKALGTYTMVSEAAWARAEGELVGRELGSLRVVGRQEPVRVFEPLGFAGEEEADAMERFTRAIQLCREAQWQEALALFQAMPDDPAACTYAAKCRDLLDGRETDWDAVWNLTAK